jgi:RNA polymerase sigma-70 factor, ECF subfamily
MDTSGSQRDEELVRRARDGDDRAVVALYQRYVNEIFGFAYHQLRTVQQAEDATSATFLRMVDAIGTFRGHAAFRTWLYAIARNQVRDEWRREARHPTVTLDRPLPEVPTSDASARPEATALGRAVLERLPDNYRRVLELRVMGDRSIRDTACEIGTTEGNVKVLQHRALRRAAQIAATLQDGDDEDHPN